MKIKYEFVTGAVEIEVTDDWGSLLVDMDREQYNNDHKETRRHYHLDACDYEGEDFAFHDSGFDELFPTDDQEQVEAAMSCLTDAQRDVVKAVFFQGKAVKDYAALRGITNQAASKLKVTALKKMKKFLSSGG